MDYAKSISSKQGNLVRSKVITKMSVLFNQHLAAGATKQLATNIAFEYGRDLIGFDAAETWRLSIK